MERKRARNQDKLDAGVKEKKEALLALAKSGAPKPSFRSVMGKHLSRYIHKSSRQYDPAFHAEIDKLSTWLDDIRATRHREEKWREELKEVLNLKDRPAHDSREGQLLRFAMKKDDDFRTWIISKKPEWFPMLAKPELSKEYLLDLARNGGKKPHPHSKAWAYLKACMHPQSEDFDPQFLADIITARADWFNVFRSMKLDRPKKSA